MGEGKAKEAILLLDTFAHATDSRNLLLLLHSRYNSVATSKLAGTISQPEYNLEINNICLSILDLCDKTEAALSNPLFSQLAAVSN